MSDELNLALRYVSMFVCGFGCGVALYTWLTLRRPRSTKGKS